MKISKELRWLSPYFDLAVSTYPKLVKIKSIYKIGTPTKYRIQTVGHFYDPAEDGLCKLGLRTSYQSIKFNPLKVSIAPFSKVDLLLNFAHELAHTYHFTHSPEHGILECNLRIMFLTKLKLSGYIDEETELGGIQ